MITAGNICHACPHCVRGSWTCGQTGRPIAEQAGNQDCPLGKFPPPGTAVTVSGPPAVIPPPIDPAIFRALWKELHERPGKCDLATEAIWLARWIGRVPCGACRASAALLIQTTPPALAAWAAQPDGKTQYARWGWALHNAVTARIPGKIQLAWEDARRRWGW